jgi:hypothetical protein
MLISILLLSADETHRLNNLAKFLPAVVESEHVLVQSGLANGRPFCGAACETKSNGVH